MGEMGDSQVVPLDYDPHPSSGFFDDAVMSDPHEVDENVRDSGPIEETQFVNLEKDTQAPEKYVFQTVENASAPIVPETRAFLPIERPPSASLEDISESFRFGAAPKTLLGKYTLSHGQKKFSAVASASSELPPSQPPATALPLDQPVAPTATASNVSVAAKTSTAVASMPTKSESVSIQTPAITQSLNVLPITSTTSGVTSGQTSNTSTSSSTKIVAAQSPDAKPVSAFPSNTAPLPHKQKSASTIGTHASTAVSTKRGPVPFSMKPPQRASGHRPSELITAVPTTIFKGGTASQAVPKSFQKSSNRALPQPQQAIQPIVQQLPVISREAPKQEPSHTDATVKGKRVPPSISKPPIQRKTWIQQGRYRVPQSNRPIRSMGRPFPEVQGETSLFKWPANPQPETNETASYAGSRQISGGMQQYPPENQTVSADHQSGLVEPTNNEAHPIPPVHPEYDASFSQPVPRAGAQSPAVSEMSHRSNVSARMNRPTPTTPQQQTPRVSHLMEKPVRAPPQERTPQVLRAIHDGKVSKPTSNPKGASAPGIKLQTTKAIAASPKLKDGFIPLAVEQVVEAKSLEPEHEDTAAGAEQAPIPLVAEQINGSEPKNVQSKSSTLKDWVWRENLSRIYEEKISSLQTVLGEKEAEIKSIEAKLDEQEKKIQSTDEALRSTNEELQSMHKEFLSTRKAEKAAANRIEDLKAEKAKTVEKVAKWERLNKTYTDHMNKVVDSQNALKAEAGKIKACALSRKEEAASMNEAAAAKITKALEELKAAKAELRTQAETEKAAADAKKRLEKVTREKETIQKDLVAAKNANITHERTIKRDKDTMDKYLLTAQQERSKAEKLQKQLNEEKQAHTKFISTLENLPQKVSTELSKQDSPLAKLLSSDTSLQDKFDESTKILNELKAHEIQPSSPLVKIIENLFAQIPQLPSPSQDGRASREQAVAKLLEDLQASLDNFKLDIETKTKLEAKVSELQQNNETLSAVGSATIQEKEKLAGELEDSRRQANDHRSQLESKIRELEALQALPREDPQLVAKIGELEGTNLSLQGQLKEFSGLQKENEGLEEKVRGYENQCSRHEKEKEELQNSFTAQKKKDNEIAEKVRKESTFQSDRKIKCLRLNLHNTESELNQLKSKASTQLEENKKLRQDAERHQKVHENTTTEAQRHTNKLTSENVIFRNQISALKAELGKSVKLTLVTAEKEVLQNQITDLRAELAKSSQVTAEKGALQNQIADLRAELANSVKSSQVTAEKEVLQNQIANLRAELAKSIRSSQVAVDKEVLQNQIVDLRAELAKSVKPSQVVAEKEALLKQISELQRNAAMREDAAVLRQPLMDTPRNMLRKNSQKLFTRHREIPETQLEEDIEDSLENPHLPQINLKESSLPAKRRPSGRLGLASEPRTITPVNQINSQDSKATPSSDSQLRPQEHGRGASQASRNQLPSQPVESTPLKSFSAMDSGNWSANSALTDVDECDGDYDQLGTVYEQARAKKAGKSVSSSNVETFPSDYQPTPSSREFSDPDEELEKLRAQNIASRATARRQPSHRKTSASTLKSALKPSSTNLGPREANMEGPLNQPTTTMTASQTKNQVTSRKNPYNRVASGSTSNRHQAPNTSPLPNGGVSRRNSVLGAKRKADTELVSPKAPKAMMTRTLSNNRSKMPPPPFAPTRRTSVSPKAPKPLMTRASNNNRSKMPPPPSASTRTSARSSTMIPPLESTLSSASPRVSLPPPTAVSKARNPVRR